MLLLYIYHITMSYFLTRRVAKAEDGIDDLKLSINYTNATVSVINGNIGTLQGNITSLNTTATSLQGSISNLNSTISSINADVGTLNIATASLQGNINSINSTLNTSVGTLQGNITTLNIATASLQGSITSINSTLNTSVVKSIVSQSTGLTVSNNGSGGYSLSLPVLRTMYQEPPVEGFGSIILPGYVGYEYFTNNAWRVNLSNLDLTNFEYSITLDIQTKGNPVDTYLRWSWYNDFWTTGNQRYRQNWLEFGPQQSYFSGDNFDNKLVYLRGLAHTQHHLKMNLRRPINDSSYYPRICLQCDCVQTSNDQNTDTHTRPLFVSRSFNVYIGNMPENFSGTDKKIMFYIDTGSKSTTDNYCSNNSAWVRVVKIPI